MLQQQVFGTSVTSAQFHARALQSFVKQKKKLYYWAFMEKGKGKFMVRRRKKKVQDAIFQLYAYLLLHLFSC